MRIFVAVNQIDQIGDRQTTALLIGALARRQCDVSLANVQDFLVKTESGTAMFLVNATAVPENSDFDSKQVDLFSKSNPNFSIQIIEPDDLILIRTNPGRDTVRASVHESFLDICRAAQASGVQVVNDPTHLNYFASKACLAEIDTKFCPPMIVSNRADLIADFVRQADNDCVVKPMVGSRGRNVIRVAPDSDNLESLIKNAFAGAAIVAQHFVRADAPGDRRVVVVAGEILEIDGQLGGIERRPGDGDFRANLHAGGSAHPLQLDRAARATAEYAARLLNDHGIWLAGVDLVGDKIIEFNVFSTGGLYDAEQFSGVCFSDEIAERLLAQQHHV